MSSRTCQQSFRTNSIPNDMTDRFSQHDAVLKLDFPVSFPEIPSHLAGILDISSEEIHAQLGEPSVISNEQGLGPTEFWAFEYKCGLQLVYQYYQLVRNMHVCGDSPEVGHAIRHMPFPVARIYTIHPDGLE